MKKIYYGLFGWLLCLLACNLEVIDPIVPTKFIVNIGGGGNDFPYDILANADGTFIVAGSSQSTVYGNQAYIAKVAANGELINANEFGWLGDEKAMAIVPTPDGGYILAGQKSNPVTFNINLFIIKVNSDLNQVWADSTGSIDSTELAFGIVAVDNNEYIIGYAQSYVNGGDIMPIKFLRINENGVHKSTNIATDGLITIQDMIRTSDKKIVLAGYDYSTNATVAYLARFEENGTLLWERTYPTTSQKYTLGYGVVEMADKSIVMAGSDQVDVEHDFFTVSYLQNGTQQTNNHWGTPNIADELLAVTKSNDNEIVGMGYTANAGNLQAYISKRNRITGAKIWENQFSESWTQSGDIALCPDGGFIICTAQNQPNANIILVKTDANGEFQ